MGILTITKTYPCGKVEHEVIDMDKGEEKANGPKSKNGKERKRVRKASKTVS